VISFYKGWVIILSRKVQEQENRVPEHIIRYIEDELRLYKTYKSTVSELELDLEDLLERSRQISFESVPNRNGPGDPVNLTALRSLMIEEKMKQALSRIRKIETGLTILNPEEKNIVESRYLSGVEYTHDQIIIQLRLNRNRYYKLREEIIQKFAMVFGLI
jgi:hypothetical protein